MKKILIVVDYQNDFVNGTLVFEKAQTLDSKISKRINKAHKQNELIICTLDTHNENYLNTQEGKILPIPHCIKGTKGWKIFGETNKTLKDKKYPTPVYLNKNTFGSYLLETFLKDYVKDDECVIELCGVVTNMCVISNAIICKTTLPEAIININKNLCASFDDELHNQALNVMKGLQMNILEEE